MEKLFVCESELSTFKARHPEYNCFEEQRDSFGELIGYNASVAKEKQQLKLINSLKQTII